MARRSSRAGTDGQVLVIFAIGLVALLAFASLAFDIGRFYSERRFLQNAADAGALAAANALTRGETTAQADAKARDVLARNLVGSPNASNPSLPPTTPVYEAGHAGDANYLINGIVMSGSDVRVAVQSDVGYTFGRAVGLSTNTIVARARARTNGEMLPIAVRHYINAPGPTVGAAAPCSMNLNAFNDLLSTADTACLGTSSDASLRTTPSAGAAFNASSPGDDPSHHGPIISLVGQGAAPGNAANFRGFIVVDTRNFASASSNVFYNGVTAGTAPNVLKAKEAGWVAIGYPGPDFPPVTSPPDPNDQVGIMDGNSAGIVVDAIGQRYSPGSEILAAVYSGTTMTIPDFTYTVANTVTIGINQNRNNAVTMSLAKNAAFAGVVTTTSFADWGDPANPYGTTLTPITLSPNPATPNTTVRWATFATSGAPVGVHTIWIKGHSSSPYLTDHYYPVAISIGSVNRDFSSTGGGTVIAVSTTGATGTGTMPFSTGTGGSTFGGNVTLSIEGGPQSNGVLPSGIGAVSITPTVNLASSGTRTATITINGGTLAPGEYPLTVRATGTNSAGQVVTRQIPFIFDIATGATSNEYVDIMGFAVFRITAVNSNSIDGYAITGVYPDSKDERLHRGQVARLVPWN
ncbi:MAG TPA: pilus assembly protein TadG-related protein [Candidatus Limnocylindrales bacterium]|nr:pilus assembly protein TadG-related protein [Candidatus Limnocylindrales bacterium]